MEQGWWTSVVVGVADGGGLVDGRAVVDAVDAAAHVDGSAAVDASEVEDGAGMVARQASGQGGGLR